ERSPADRAALPAEEGCRCPASPGGSGGQGHHLRLRRPFAEDRRGHGGHEDRHGRQRGGAGGDVGGGDAGSALSGDRLPRPSGEGDRPGDVLISRLGKTVEVTNTDAEGRLVLGDVLAYAVEQKPSAVIDLATLTGAVVIALGLWMGGAFSNDDALAEEVLAAARRAGESFWRLPLVDLQKETLRSEVADMKNSGDRWGGAITAAVFLKEFIGQTPWVHLDIAGTSQAMRERGYQSKGATGVGVRTLVEFLKGRTLPA